METILNFNCFPAGMELFPAVDEDIFEYIKRIIDDSDYYMLIIGGRYGSVDENGISWTEREFDYAVSQHKPVIVFDHKDFTKLSADKTDLDDKKRKKLIAFKKKASTGRLIKKWKNVDELDAAVAKSLPKVLEQQPGTGWVRADKDISKEAQKEFDKPKAEIEKYKKEAKRLDADLKQKDEAYIILNSSYQLEKQQTKNFDKLVKSLNERIKTLEAELERHKTSSGTTTTKSQPHTEIITIPGTDVSFKMIHVEGGTFMMGANEGDTEAYGEEKPAHEVSLSEYWMGETQVTQELWQAVMGENPSEFKGDPNRPVENVSWLDCREFIQRLKNLTGKKFHMPTEAQWEFAARGGIRSKGFKYSGSHDLFDVAWYNENSKGNTHPVGERDPNELGLYDMSGNLWEWCNDWYDGDYYSNSPTSNPTGPTSGSKRVCRGGCWDNDTRSYRVSYRGCDTPTSADRYIGLRLAL